MWVESVFKWLEPSVLEGSDTLTNSLVQNIYTVSATVSARNSSGLTVEAHTKSAEVAERVDRVLSAKDIVSTREANGNSTLNTPMSRRAVRSESGSLHREDLIGSELLLIKCLLLLLQCFDLLLNGDLYRSSAFDNKLWRCR